MKLEEYRRRLQQDPEYLAAKAELKPFLDLADEVLELRLERGWSQSELARRAGTKQANISRVESGVVNPTVKFLQKLAKAFDTELTISLRPKPPVSKTKVVYIPVKHTRLWKDQRSTQVTWDVLYKASSSPRREKQVCRTAGLFDLFAMSSQFTDRASMKNYLGSWSESLCRAAPDPYQSEVEHERI